MSGTVLGWAAPSAAISLGTAFNGLAAGGPVTVGPIDNTVATLGHAAYDTAELELVFASTTVGAGNPSINLAVADAFSSGNYQTAGAVSTTPYPLTNSAVEPLMPSTAYTVILVRFAIRPVLFKVLVINNMLVPFPSPVTANLYLLQGRAG